MDGSDSESQSQMHGAQEEEERLTEANPSTKCQYRGGPIMYPAKHTAIIPSPAFKTLGFTAISWLIASRESLSLFWCNYNLSIYKV